MHSIIKLLIYLIAIQINLFDIQILRKFALLSVKHSIFVIQINICEYVGSKYTVNVISKISKNAHWKFKLVIQCLVI